MVNAGSQTPERSHGSGREDPDPSEAHRSGCCSCLLRQTPGCSEGQALHPIITQFEICLLQSGMHPDKESGSACWFPFSALHLLSALSTLSEAFFNSNSFWKFRIVIINLKRGQNSPVYSVFRPEISLTPKFWRAFRAPIPLMASWSQIFGTAGKGKNWNSAVTEHFIVSGHSVKALHRKYVKYR